MPVLSIPSLLGEKAKLGKVHSGKNPHIGRIGGFSSLFCMGHVVPRYFSSTRRRCAPADLATAVFQSLAPDGGLYWPEALPRLQPSDYAHWPSLSLPEIATEQAERLLGYWVPKPVLARICTEAFDFPLPVVEVGDAACLELFHGPSLAFKDFGARFMSRLMAWLLEQEHDSRPLHILVATSGDTGGAVAKGFAGVEGITVTILFPQGGVSDFQYRQLTGSGGNVRALAVEGSFDDCQALVKSAFADEALRQTLRLSSANSINWARLMPQTFYYTAAWAWYGQGKPMVWAVPSGNYGNLCAGLLGKRMGLPLGTFIAASNANSVVPEYLASGQYQPRPSVKTLSNAMDVGAPSNFERLMTLYPGGWARLREDLWGASFTDAQTLEALHELKSLGYLSEPHTAVAWLAWKAWKNAHPQPETSGLRALFLGTAHPLKFENELPEDLRWTAVKGPESWPLSALQEATDGQATPLSARYADFRQFLLESPQ